MPPWILVTPATRGIGLEFARRLLRTTDLPVVATARGSTDQAKESILQARKDGQFPDVDNEGDESRLHVMKLDVTGMLPPVLLLHAHSAVPCQTSKASNPAPQKTSKQ